MKFLIDNWALLTVALTSGGLLFWPIFKDSKGSAVTPEGAVQLINREKAVLIDVCEPNEYGSGHAIGAKNVPFGELEAKLPVALKNKALPVILVCQTGARSGRAVSIVKKLGFQQVLSLSGGLNAWRSLNLPIEKS